LRVSIAKLNERSNFSIQSPIYTLSSLYRIRWIYFDK